MRICEQSSRVLVWPPQAVAFGAGRRALSCRRVHVGTFMAHEMGMPLARLNIMVGVAKLERANKGDADLVPLVAAARALVSPRTSLAPRAGASAAIAGATL